MKKKREWAEGKGKSKIGKQDKKMTADTELYLQSVYDIRREPL